MPAASRTTSAVPCLRKAAGFHAAGLQPARHQPAVQQNSSGGPRGTRSGPRGTRSGPRGPARRSCFAAPPAVGCGPAASGPAAFLRHGAADAALLAAGMQACVGGKLVAHQAAQCVTSKSLWKGAACVKA